MRLPCSYDGINRLTNMERGDLNGSFDTISNKQFAQDWSLDETGNWGGFKEATEAADRTGRIKAEGASLSVHSTWDLDQSRTSNVVNELTNITETAGSSWANPS